MKKFFLTKLAFTFFILAAVASTHLIAPGSLLAQGADTFGTIETPPGVDKYQADAAAEGADIGIILFLSRALRISAIAAGIWVTFNVLLAAFQYLSKGDKAAHTKVADILTMSVIGLLLIVTSYTMAALIGQLLFNNPMYIINPQIEGPVSVL